MAAYEHPELERADDDRLIACLLDSPSVGVAAALAGVSESAARQRLRDPEFLSRLRQVRESAFAAAVAAVQDAGAEAVEVLREIAADPSKPTPSRVRAALGILAAGQREIERESIEAPERAERRRAEALAAGNEAAFRAAGGTETEWLLSRMD